ncbi:MFS transporter [Tsukamurella pseudospumae]|uniref:MFS transporter n=1 Tax=Tsukamurella pseudospumae TaxID=239498 RepID=A0A138AQE6_9ACTN|nr:MFS transporter [Tsukamurella pseudospumae]KXO97874.1 MFS transporter [Tsukamurella pseudospumae]KXP12645.1 MFS transporter [Tsukamurella pseudospumae]
MRAWIVWSVATLAYVIGVLQRTSFGVSGTDAAARYGAAPATLSAFVVLQLVVYAGMQIPAGLMLDRFGSRRLVFTGAMIMAAGQMTLALTESLPLAIAGRVAVGIGDSLTFVSVLRLVPAWFPVRRIPLVTQLTGMTGQLGQILSAVPFLALLHADGWTPAYLGAASLGLIAAIAVLAFVRDAPPEKVAPKVTVRAQDIPGILRSTWMHPGTRLGFFTHMGAMFSVTAFMLMWGVPYLTTAQGLSSGEAGAIVTFGVVATLASGPVIGYLTGRFPTRRSWMVIAIIIGSAAVWTAVLVRDEPSPVWLLTVLVLVISVGGPSSAIGFDYARSFNTSRVLGTAQGMVNIGGFLASLVLIQAMGSIMGAGAGLTFDGFRAAWLAQYPLWAIALIGVVITRRKARRREGVVPRPLREALRRTR